MAFATRDMEIMFMEFYDKLVDNTYKVCYFTTYDNYNVVGEPIKIDYDNKPKNYTKRGRDRCINSVR